MRFIRVHALVNFLSPVNASSYSLHNYLVLFSVALLVVGWRSGFASHELTPAFYRGWNLPLIGIFCFTMNFFQHLGPSEKYRGLCSVLEGYTSTLCVSNVFRRKLWRCQKTCLLSPRELSLIFFPDPLGIILSCQQVFQILQPLCLCGGLMDVCFLFPCVKKNLRDWSTPVSDVLESLLPAFLFRFSATKRFLTGSLPCSLTGYLW